MEYLNLILLSVFTLLQIADSVTTYLNLKRPDRVEANKWLKAIMDKLGILPTLILMKVLAVGAFVVAYIFADTIYLSMVLGVACIGYCWVTYNNINLLRS